MSSWNKGIFLLLIFLFNLCAAHEPGNPPTAHGRENKNVYVQPSGAPEAAAAEQSVSADGKYVAVLKISDALGQDPPFGILSIKEKSTGKTIFTVPLNEPAGGLYDGPEAHLPANPRYVKHFKWNPILPVIAFDCAFMGAAKLAWTQLSSIGVFDCRNKRLHWIAGKFHNWREMHSKYDALGDSEYAPIWLDQYRIKTDSDCVLVYKDGVSRCLIQNKSLLKTIGSQGQVAGAITDKQAVGLLEKIKQSPNIYSMMVERPEETELTSPPEVVKAIKTDREWLTEARVANSFIVFRKIRVSELGLPPIYLQGRFLVLDLALPYKNYTTIYIRNYQGKPGMYFGRYPLRLVFYSSHGQWKVFTYLNFLRKGEFFYTEDGINLSGNFVL